MSHKLWFSAGGESIREALHAALDWCNQCCIVGAAPIGSHDSFWSEVERHGSRVRAVIVSGLERSASDTLQGLQRRGVLRRFADGAGRGHAVWFERGDEVRFLLAPAALGDDAISGAGVWCCWEGPRVDMPEALSSFAGRSWSDSIAVNDGDWERLANPPSAPAVYSRPIPSVREVLGVRSPRDFFELDEEAQTHALWSTLIGEGPIDLEQAIRWCAERLRAQGVLDYERLVQGGRVHQALEERLLAARRGTELFDRPRNGFVRAVQRDLDGVTAEQWRDCVIGALEPNARVDREEALRLGFTRAQDVYGVDVQRLRGGGRAEKALRSAINSAVRQGYFERDGAAYLTRRAKNAAPTLRGALAAETVEETPESEHPPSSPESAAPAATVESADATAREAPSPEQPETVAKTDRGSPLERNLWELDFPTRTLNWAERHGITSVRNLVAWRPEAFAAERNVGRRTVRETRERIEAHLGCSWEEAYRAVHGGTELRAAGSPEGDDDIDSTTEALTAGGAAGWTALGSSLTDEQRRLPLIDLELPTRMKSFAREQALTSLGELFAVPYATLAARPNMGRRSLNDTLDAVRDHLSELSAPARYTTFLEAFQAQLAALEPIPRMIVTRRAGLHGARETLEELGSMLGVTRERARQIEARVIERLRERSRWRREVEAKVAAAFGEARALPLALLGEEPWWAGIDRHELLLDYVVRRIFDDELFLLEAPSGKRYLAKFSEEALSASIENAKNRVSKLEYPVAKTAIDEILRSEAARLDPILFAELEHVVGELVLLDAEKPELAIGFGRNRDAEVIAFLGNQPEPVPVSLLEERCGRGRLPDEVLYFKRGLVGLKRHFPDFDAWMERLVPPSLEVMQERPAGRQWMVPEIHDALRERGLVPEWLGHWHLASLLRLSDRVDYLGRLRVATKGSGQEERLEYEDLVQELLEDAGGPLDFDELLRRARVRADLAETTAVQMVRQAPFVRLDERRIGLVERDIPGGPTAVAAAIEAVVQTLRSTQHGLTPHQATRIVNALGGAHASWQRQLVTSVLRNEPSIRIDRTKNIGLEEWDDVRCPARPEFIGAEVHRAGGRISIRELSEKLEATFGRAPDRGGLGVLVSQLGLVIDGDRVLLPSERDVATETAPRPPLNLTGIPTELREMFEELVKEPLMSAGELRRHVDEHVAQIEKEHRVNEFVDLEGARAVARQCHLLLDRWETLTSTDRHVAHAAVRYFVSWHDIEHDLDLGGLDDDKQLVNAVLGYLALDEQRNAVAS